MKKLSETPRTDEVRHNVADLAMHARKLERELAELKAIHKTAITDCQQYTPERWKEQTKPSVYTTQRETTSGKKQPMKPTSLPES